MEINIYTDGSAIGNPWPWGRGAIIWRTSVSEQEIVLSGAQKDTTNNVMELTAVMRSLEELVKLYNIWPLPQENSWAWFFETPQQQHSILDETIHIYTDSTYVQKWITERLSTRVRRDRRRSKWWKLIWNVVLRKYTHALLAYFSNLHIHRVKGHAGHEMNERVDDLARGAAEKCANNFSI